MKTKKTKKTKVRSVTVRRGVTLNVAKFESVRLDVEMSADTDDVEEVDRLVREELAKRVSQVSKRERKDFEPYDYIGDQDINLSLHGFHQD